MRADDRGGEGAQKKLMVAYRLRYEPYNKAAIEMCRSKCARRSVQIEGRSTCRTPAAEHSPEQKRSAAGPRATSGSTASTPAANLRARNQLK
jgi:hypothetical protein